MHTFLVCAYKSQDFVQSQESFARSHNLVTVSFRNSDFAHIEVYFMGIQQYKPFKSDPNLLARPSPPPPFGILPGGKKKC